jgi:hypothetical protein
MLAMVLILRIAKDPATSLSKATLIASAEICGNAQYRTKDQTTKTSNP